MQSRYYDPTIGRFINADEPLLLMIDSHCVSLYTYCKNNVISEIDYTGFLSTEIYTYDGISYTKNSKGFSVKNNAKFVSKKYCKQCAERIIKLWGSKGKYCNMNAHRIASEIFAHEILFILGWMSLSVSAWNLSVFISKKKLLNRITYLVNGVLAGKISKYLLGHAEIIDVNNDEKWYRLVIFEMIWTFYPPVVW